MSQNAENQTNSSKVAIVTGGSRGIGAAVAQQLARDGFSVVVNYSSEAASAEALVAELAAFGAKALAVQADVRAPAEVRRLFDATERAFGRVDVLVNNAGVMPLASVADMDDAAFDRVIAVNLKGSFNAMREAAKRLQHGGRIINFSSSVVGLLQPTYGAYAASKAGIEALTSVLAKELRGKNVTVNAVAPGPTATDLFLRGKAPEVVERLAKLAPLERLGEPEDIARVVSFLVGPNGAWINGQVVRANGGII
jgi:3-oxoacyl-[acyl-carrier protein] reductase